MREVLERIEYMLTANGSDLYGGEAITQTEHALQCAALAEARNSSAKLITASLLHDIGHLLEPDFGNTIRPEKDMVHEDLGEAFLEEWFDEEVTQPVKLHVDAKRYLCATDDTYLGKLSQASVHSLALQGGPMSDAEQRAFESYPYYSHALRVRVWDDLAKVPDAVTPNVSHFMQYVEQSLRTRNQDHNP